jgi:hypothetical protein
MRSSNDDLRNGSAVVMDADGSGTKLLFWYYATLPMQRLVNSVIRSGNAKIR